MFLRILDRLEELLIMTLIAAATVIIFIAVAHRYLVGDPFFYPFVFRSTCRGRRSCAS